MKRALPAESKPSDKGRVKRPELDPSSQSQPPLTISVVLDRRSTKAQKKLTPEQERQLQVLKERLNRDVAAFKDDITYSAIYADDIYQYRHITLPQQLARYLPDPKEEILLKEHEYRRLGIGISTGWEHYMIYQPEPNILLLRRTHELALELKAQHEAYLAAEEAKKAAQQQQQQPSNKTTESSATATSSIARRTRSKPKTTTNTTGTSAKDQQQV